MNHSHSAQELDGASVPTLLEYLRSNDVSLRCDAACAIGDRLRARELTQLDVGIHDRLVAMLAESAFGAQLEAAIALAEIQDNRATAVLLEATRSRHFRLDAIRALGTLGDRRAVAPLSKMLDSWLMPWADRLQAAAALCALGDRTGATYLETKLGSRRAAG